MLISVESMSNAINWKSDRCRGGVKPWIARPGAGVVGMRRIFPRGCRDGSGSRARMTAWDSRSALFRRQSAKRDDKPRVRTRIDRPMLLHRAGRVLAEGVAALPVACRPDR